MTYALLWLNTRIYTPNNSNHEQQVSRHIPTYTIGVKGNVYSISEKSDSRYLPSGDVPEIRTMQQQTPIPSRGGWGGLKSTIAIQQPPIEPFGSTKIALAAVIGKSPSSALWLEYYMKYLAFDLLILRVENFPEFRTYTKQYGEKIIATYADTINEFQMRKPAQFGAELGAKKVYQDNYFTIMNRQRVHINGALDLCRTMHIDFLVHLDADELLYVQPDARNPSSPRSITLRKFLSNVPIEFDYIHLNNYEAVYPAVSMVDDNNCFLTSKFLRCRDRGCLAYSNGKSIAKVKGGGYGGRTVTALPGPHRFSGRGWEVDSTSGLAVLHFESCTFELWEHKFQQLMHANDSQVRKIPFDFYKKSIALQQSRKKYPNDKKILESAIALYKKAKVAPYVRAPYDLRAWEGTLTGRFAGEAVMANNKTSDINVISP